MPLFLLTVKAKMEKPNESWESAAIEAGKKFMQGVQEKSRLKKNSSLQRCIIFIKTKSCDFMN